MKVILAVAVLVAAAFGGIPFAVWLMTVNLYGGLVTAGAAALVGWATMRFIDRRLAWGKPRPGEELPGESWKHPPPSAGGGMGGGMGGGI